MEDFKKIVDELEKSLAEVRVGFLDDCQRDSAFSKFKEVALKSLWKACQEMSDRHQQLAMLLRLTLRKMGPSPHLASLHLDAFQSILTCLRKESISPEDIKRCRLSLSGTGIETLVSFGEKTTTYLSLLEE